MTTIDDITCIRDEKEGLVALRIALVANVWFENGWTRPVREAVAELAEHYLAFFGSRIRWVEEEPYLKDERTKYYAIGSDQFKRPSAWLPGHDEDQWWRLSYYASERERDASEIQVEAFNGKHSRRRNEPGLFHVHVPLTWFSDNGGTLVDLIKPICQRLKPLSGSAGLGVIECRHGGVVARYQPTVRQFAERFPGLEIHSVVSANHLTSGIKCANWLNILSDRWIQELGGLDYLRIRLDDNNFPFHTYEGGIIIQAGQRPQLGDAEKDLWPAQYVTLAKVLRKIQVKEHYALHMGGRPGVPKLDQEATMKWLYRFDGK